MKQLFILFLSFITISSCNKDEAIPYPEDNFPEGSVYSISIIDSYLLNIAEPSGLSWALNKKDLIVVDDRTNKAYIINTKGETLSEYPYIGDDTEGVTINYANNSIWIAEEAESKLIELNTNGVQTNSYKIDIERDSKKKGLEGLTFDSENELFYILNEGTPGLLIKWQIDNGIISQKQLSFADDYSGIYYENSDSSLWIVSDQSKKLYYCNTDAVVIQSFRLDYTKAEGIVVDITNRRIYTISDSEHKLYIYKITKL